MSFNCRDKSQNIIILAKNIHNESSLLVQEVYSLMYKAVTRNAMLKN